MPLPNWLRSKWLFVGLGGVLLCLIGVGGVLYLNTPATPRAPEILATVKVGSFSYSPGYSISNPRTGYTYVVHSGAVSILKGTSPIVLKKPAGGDGPARLALDEIEGWVYITSQYNDTVAVLRGMEVITTIQTFGHGPRDITTEPHTHVAYVVSGHNKNKEVEGNILLLKGTQIIGNLNLGRVLLTHVVADPVSGYVYAGDVGGEIIAVKNMQVLMRHQLPKVRGISPGILDMAADPRNGDVYVLDGFYNLTRFRAGQMVDALKIQSRTQVMQVHPHTGDVYITRGGDLYGDVLIVRDMKELAHVPAGGGPAHIAIDPKTGNVYVANFRENTVTVIHGTEVLATIKVGRYPYGLSVNPANGWVYVSNDNDGTMSVLGYR
jgi:YVTN family beta-propeller protein